MNLTQTSQGVGGQITSGVNQLVSTLKRKMTATRPTEGGGGIILDTETSEAPLLTHELSPPHKVVSERNEMFTITHTLGLHGSSSMPEANHILDNSLDEVKRASNQE